MPDLDHLVGAFPLARLAGELACAAECGGGAGGVDLLLHVRPRCAERVVAGDLVAVAVRGDRLPAPAPRPLAPRIGRLRPKRRRPRRSLAEVAFEDRGRPLLDQLLPFGEA